MEIRDKINHILQGWQLQSVSTDEAIDAILLSFGIEPYVILIQEWEEDPDDGWTTPWGWEYENGKLFDEVGYELEEILDKDSHGRITKARFKYVG